MRDNQHQPYTHLRAAIDDGITCLDVSFYTPDLAVSVFCIDQERACLDISSADGQVSISSTGGGPVTRADIALARELAHAAARYLSECERLYAKRHLPPAAWWGRWNWYFRRPLISLDTTSREGSSLMFKKLPGDETARLVSTTPDTAVVFRPAVVQTPAILTIAIAVWRMLTGVVGLVWRHPIALAITVGLGVIWTRYGYLHVLALAGLAVAAGVSWRLVDRPSFLRLVGWPLLGWWRLVSVYRRHWQPVMIVSGLGRYLRGRDCLPRLLAVTCTPWADLVTVKMLSGQAVTDWTDRTEHLAHGFGATSCRISVQRSGRLLLTFPRSDPLAVPLSAVPVPETAAAGPVQVGMQENGHPWLLKLHGTHVLVAGATGAGKGSVIWSAIRGLLPAMRAGLVQVWALDPKLMELSYGRAIFGDRYAADPDACADLLDAAVKVMQERAGRFAGVQRNHTPTFEDPFVLVVVDEVAFLTAYQPDKHLRQRITAALATLTTQGRAVGVGVLAALQDPRKEVMNIRNLFPDKIALRLDESEQVDMVLGDGARDRGALADLISPRPEAGAGIGYVRLETSPDPVRVRAAYVSDADIRAMAAEFAPVGEAV